MIVLKSTNDLISYLANIDNVKGYVADTGFLYALSFDDDRLHISAHDVLETLSDLDIPLYANVISRMEFIDLIFRKLVTNGIIQVYDNMTSNTNHKNLWNLFKNVRDQNTASKSTSYKVDESRLKKIRFELEQANSSLSWKRFCETYMEDKLYNEWVFIEEQLGLNFIEIMEGNISNEFNEPLYWSDMVKVMGKHGLRGPDAMIANIFAKSKFPLLITTDSDFEKCFSDPLDDIANKAIYIL